jgi:acetyltransferase
MQTFIPAATDRAYDILRSEHRPLDAIFAPSTIALIGASDREGSVGRTVLWNLITNSFGGTIFPVNPNRHSVLGIRAYTTVSDIPDPIDLAIIATPAPTVPDVIRQCVDANVKGAIVLSAGFKEAGTAGADLEHQIQAELKRGKMRLIGPNCLGVMNPHLGLNATFANAMALPGTVGFISQSGALCSAILDWSFHANVGFSSFISIGSMLDVNWGDLIYYLGDDPHTQSIVLYMESIGDARSFLSAAREVALTKPIIVIKSGRTEAAAKAATSHTGALAGSDDVFDAALRRCGVLRVTHISDLFDMADVLSKQPRPQGPRLAIVTNAGGPGVLATDALIHEGGQLATLAPETITALNQGLPTAWSKGNPIDILGDADPTRYAKTLEIVAKDPNSDGILVILTPQAMTHPTQTAVQLRSFAHLGKPMLASWMGDVEVEDGAEILNQANIPTFPYPDTAAQLFNYMWRYSENLRSLYETPTLTPEVDLPHRHWATTLLQSIQQTGRTLLTEMESKQLLAAYGIPTVETYIAQDVGQAVQLADALGYPVVLKLLSETITHKTDIGGVKLDVATAEDARQAYLEIAKAVEPKDFRGVTVQPMIHYQGYELIIGSSVDPQFGTVIAFGTGGQLVEVYRDRALTLPPLNTTLARRLIEQTRIYPALKGVRGRKPIDLAALETLLVQFSQLVVEQPWIQEIDINPLIAQSETPSLLALDARIVLHPPGARLPKPAIRPYPTQYVKTWTLRNNTPVTIRPIRPEDEPSMIQFHKTLSEESVFLRYFHLIKLSQRIAHERLTRLCFIDYDREMALVAETQPSQTESSEILAVARLSKLHNENAAEFALIVSDRIQCQGLGTELLKQLLQIGQNEHLKTIRAEILAENRPMQHICEKLGFQLHPTPDPSVLQAEIKLYNDL